MSCAARRGRLPDAGSAAPARSARRRWERLRARPWLPTRPVPGKRGRGPRPRTLLPLDSLALAALAVQVHGWELDVRSGCLPQGILGRTDALRHAVEGGVNNLGHWHAT
ncbi:Imm49 family immunity protein [Streptomyces sp. NPDC046324]|uniref:Imm49 family immunity protein n=1 Tax=Streptomyces sp. NPDC046324 TaxID=3154915 RepID=UPI00340C0B97